jgi:DNA-binding SARP family transcriptional activator
MVIEARNDSLELDSSVEVDIRRASELARSFVAGFFTQDAVMLFEPDFAYELLPGWYDEWIVVQRERHRQLSLYALESLCAHLTSEGHYGPAVLAGLAAIDREPLRESAHRALIRVHLAEGNASEAIGRYRQYEALAARELGTVPSDLMRSLFAEIPTGYVDSDHVQRLSR